MKLKKHLNKKNFNMDQHFPGDANKYSIKCKGQEKNSNKKASCICIPILFPLK